MIIFKKGRIDMSSKKLSMENFILQETLILEERDAQIRALKEQEKMRAMTFMLALKKILWKSNHTKQNSSLRESLGLLALTTIFKSKKGAAQVQKV